MFVGSRLCEREVRVVLRFPEFIITLVSVRLKTSIVEKAPGAGSFCVDKLTMMEAAGV